MRYQLTRLDADRTPIGEFDTDVQARAQADYIARDQGYQLTWKAFFGRKWIGTPAASGDTIFGYEVLGR
jgi:hypothetical protein